MYQIFFVAIFCIQSLFAQENKEQLKQELQTITQALNQGNIDSIASLLTDDAEMSRPLIGDVLQGKEAILKFLKERSQERKERNLQFSFKPESVEFPDADTAVVEGISEVGNSQGLFLRQARRVELVKENGKWLISSIDDVEVAPAPPSHLKELEWLIGNWKDQTEGVTLTSNISLGKFQNFIIDKFNMTLYKAEVIEGVQIIGWNPAEKRIQSWIFDSDGGHGTGFWTNRGNSWEVALNYVLGDGRRGSETLIYTKVDASQHRFESRNRKINGESVPDLEPVTMAKELTKETP